MQVSPCLPGQLQGQKDSGRWRATEEQRCAPPGRLREGISSPEGSQLEAIAPRVNETALHAAHESLVAIEPAFHPSAPARLCTFRSNVIANLNKKLKAIHNNMLAISPCSRVQPRCTSISNRRYRAAPVAAAQADFTGTGSSAEARASRRAALAALVAGVAAIPQRAGADEKAPRQGEVRVITS